MLWQSLEKEKKLFSSLGGHIRTRKHHKYILPQERIQSSTCQYAHTQSIHQQGMESWKLVISVIKVASIQRPMVEKRIVQQQVKHPSKQ
jgi:hypothetical protein